jgi:hypothetical protein
MGTSNGKSTGKVTDRNHPLAKSQDTLTGKPICEFTSCKLANRSTNQDKGYEKTRFLVIHSKFPGKDQNQKELHKITKPVDYPYGKKYIDILPEPFVQGKPRIQGKAGFCV